MPTMKNPREGDLVKACLAYLTLQNIPAWRMNTGATRVGERFIRFGTPGMADIIGIYPGGRFLAVETKSPKGRLRPTQEVWLQRVRDAGGVALVVRSLEELIRGLTNGL